MRAALDELGAEDRALVELYVVRQLGDVEIAELLRVEVSRVTDRRRRAFDRLAAAAGAESASERAEMMDALRDERAVAEEPAETPGRRRPWGWLALLALGLAGFVAAILALAGGGDEQSDGAARDSREQALPTRGAAMRPLAGGPGRGFGRLVREGERTRLSLDVRGLPDPGAGRYALWLYGSVTDARRLAGFPKGSFQADVPLPDGYERYRYLDVSREPDDSIPAHSGQSVLRVPLRRLRAPVR